MYNFSPNFLGIIAWAEGPRNAFGHRLHDGQQDGHVSIPRWLATFNSPTQS